MKKLSCLLLILMLLVPVLALAYEAVDFALPQTVGEFSLQIPEGWTVQPNEKDAARTDYFDEDIKGKERGIVETVLTEVSEPLFQTVDEANALLLARMKKEKIKEYELTTVAGCPAVRWTNTITLAAVKKTYVHGVYILGKNQNLDVFFSTRAADKELQAAEFEKLLATITVAEAPAVPQSVLPIVGELLGKGLTLEEAGTELEALLGNRMEYMRYNGDAGTKIEFVGSNGKKALFMDALYTYQYYKYDDNGKMMEYFETYPDKTVENATLDQGAKHIFDVLNRMRLDFGDVVRVEEMRFDEETKQVVVTPGAGADWSLADITALMEKTRESGDEVRLFYFGEGKERMEVWVNVEQGKKAKNGESLFAFFVRFRVSADVPG